MSRIQELNDAFCRTFQGGQVLITASVSALSPEIVAQVLQRIRTFEDFTTENDPQEEHDFGSFEELAGHSFFWKIDYYDESMEYGTENPADPEKTTRVLTVMLAEDY